MKKVKLIRDHMNPQGDCDTYVLQTEEDPTRRRDAAHCVLLISKIAEEAAEIAKDMEDPYEYADVLEALMTLAKINGLSWDQVKVARKEKLEERGGFITGKYVVRYS